MKTASCELVNHRRSALLLRDVPAIILRFLQALVDRAPNQHGEAGMHRPRLDMFAGSEIKPHHARPASVLHRPALLLVLTALLLPGCATWGSRPASEALSRSRQIALQGIEAEQKGKWQEAEQIYAAAVQTCPHDDRAQCRYAESLWRRGAYPEALAHMEESVRLSNQSAERFTQLARMNHDLGHLDQAQAQATRALECDRDYAAAWTLQGDIARRENRLDDALAHYQRATTLSERTHLVHLKIADIYAQQNRPQRALSALQSLTEQFPAGHVPAEVNYRQGLAYRALGRFDEAVAQFSVAAQNPQAPPEVLQQLAETQHQMGNPAAARLTLQMALARQPGHLPSQQLAKELALEQERLSAALPRGQ